VNSLKFQLADLVEAEEDWSEAAKILMSISMDGAGRSAPFFVFLPVYWTQPRLDHTLMRIVYGCMCGLCDYS
jgi:hypothetical protein